MRLSDRGKELRAARYLALLEALGKQLLAANLPDEVPLNGAIYIISAI
jgi:hypothetical protein